MALRTVAIPAAMVLRDLMLAVVTLILHAAQHRRMATQQMPADIEAMAIQSVCLSVVNKVLLQHPL